jgi:hypothetical protein
MNYTALFPNKEIELMILESSFIQEAPTPDSTDTDSSSTPSQPAPPRKVKLSVPGKVLTVQAYRSLLTSQLTSLASAKPDDQIELEIEI